MLQTLGIMIDLFARRNSICCRNAGRTCSCDEDITRFLRAKCVLSAAKPTNEIKTAIWTYSEHLDAGKTGSQRTDCVETSHPLLQEQNPTQVSLPVIKGNDFAGHR